MTEYHNTLLQDLNARSLLQQTSAHIDQHLSQPCTLYSGFDPTADSLHIGSLVPLLALRRFQQAGHTPIALVGGATGLIGDPSFKANERRLNQQDIVALWVDRLQKQTSQFIDFDCGSNSAKVVNNLDWTKSIDMLTFLRDIGKYFSVNTMIKKEAVRQRIERDESGISYTEFSYMLLQSYDFAQLNKRYGCSVQIGGSDQWGNITGGIDLVRKLNQQRVYGLTLPLVQNADGQKFGKTEKGAIWLDARKTSEYAFYQFWLNAQDADVYNFLRYFTFLDLKMLDEMARSELKPREAQKLLAQSVTQLVHGEQGLQAAERITQALFNDQLSALSEADFEQLRLDGLPSSTLTATDLTQRSMIQLLAEVGLASGKQVKDGLNSGAIWINGRVQSSESNMYLSQSLHMDNSYYGRFFIVRLGKKRYHLFEMIH